MRVTWAVFDALRTFARPATRAEIEREAQLDTDKVRWGLRYLANRKLLVVDGAARRTSTYALVAGAERPQPARGKYERDEANRLRMAAAKRAAHAHGRGNWVTQYSPASGTGHATRPGVLRIVVKGILDVRRQQPDTFGRCALDDVWKKRR